MDFRNFGLLLFVASLVSMLCRRVQIPYTVGLTVAGIGIGFLPNLPAIPLTRELIFSAILPPLIFEAAFQIPWKPLKENFTVILTLATFGVLLSIGVVVAGLSLLLKWPLPSALTLAVLISATDPVSVIATFKQINVPDRLKLLVEAESLFNDGTAAVLFSVALAFVTGQSISSTDIVRTLLLTIFGGMALGAIIAGIAIFLSGHANDHLVKITFSTLAAYSSFLLAEQLHLSGVLATLTCGLLIGNVGSYSNNSAQLKDAIESFWEYAAFVANSLVFLLIGLRVAGKVGSEMWLTAGVVILVSLLGRAIAVYASCAFFFKSSLKVSVSNQHVLVWGGLRGALALALALGLPNDMQYREQILNVTFGVVAFSVIVQGLTISPFLRKLGLVETSTSLE